MAGSGAAGGFKAKDFRDAIHFAMGMGATVDPADQAIFIFGEQSTYNPQDPDFDPYDWAATPAVDIPARQVVVPAAVQYGAATTVVEGTPVGDFDASRAIITVLDVDYALVAGCTEVMLGGHHFIIDPPGWIPFAMFDTGIWQLHVMARA